MAIAERRNLITVIAPAAWPAALALFAFALAPRALAGNFLTVDEAYHWLGRVERFLAALRQGDFAGTNLIGHPGVTTLWLGTAGALGHEWASARGLVAPDDFGARLALLRLPLALVNALAIALGYLMLRRLLDRRVALLAGLLWAAEPFLVAHAQLLHLDALLTSFMTLALLAALVATGGASPDHELAEYTRGPGSSDRERRWGWWVLSGVLGGLALLTKSPAIVLAPMIALIAAAAALPSGQGITGVVRAGGGWRSIARGLVAEAGLPTAVWCLTAAAVWFALWPAAWVDPAGALGRVVLQASAEGGAPHGWGNFFLGRAVADPGPLFYLVTTAFRLAPWTAVGLACAAGFWLYERAARRPGVSSRALLLLALFALGFTAAMSILPKKFDRYVLPIFPALDVLAAAGLLRAAGWLRRRASGSLGSTLDRQPLVWGIAAAALGLNLALHHPYPLAYFNPLLGGGAVAAQVVPVGWGEGYELAGAYIASRPNGADRPVAARYEPVLGPYAPAGAAPLAWWQTPGRVDYAVLYIDQIQRDDKPETFRPLLEREPIHTVRINGIDYAYVYQIPPPVATPLPADFGEAIHLRGYGLDTSALRSSGYITLTLEWEARGSPGADYMLFAHVFDSAGNRIGQVDVRPGGERAPTTIWARGDYHSLVQRIPLDPALPPGEYRIAIGLYDAASLQRLPLSAGARPALPEAGANALALDPFQIP